MQNRENKLGFQYKKRQYIPVNETDLMWSKIKGSTAQFIATPQGIFSTLVLLQKHLNT